MKQQLNENLKYILYILCVYVVYKIWPSILALFSKSPDKSEGRDNTGNSSKQSTQSKIENIQRVKVSSENLRRSQTYYKSVADTLYEELNAYMPWDALTIKRLINGEPTHSADELKQIYKYFGVRSQTIFGFTYNSPKNLLEWLKAWQSETDFEHTKYLFKFTGLLENQVY